MLDGLYGGWERLTSDELRRHAVASDAPAAAVETLQTLGRLQQIETNLKRSGQHVERVTLTIGGNDIGFAAILGDCYLRECLAHPEDNLADVQALKRSLVTLIGNIKKAAPQAQIILVGYPRLFPATQAGQRDMPFAAA